MTDSTPTADTTRLLKRSADGDRQATAELFERVYHRLRKLAADQMKRERPGHTLQPTALVHEAFIRMIDGKTVDWRGETHFFHVAAKQIRRALVDHARARQAKKRGGDVLAVTQADNTQDPRNVIDVLILNDALHKLEELHPRQGKVFEMRFFAGLEVKEAAAELGVSERTVKGDWQVARAWLARELSVQGPHA